MRLLGIDYGSARLGLAIGDTETRIASPWSVLAIQDDDEAVGAIQELTKKESIEKLIVGIPHALADQTRETDQARRIRVFIERLRQEGYTVEEIDETWSTSLAAKQGIEAGFKGKRDDLAAANILQGYLDRFFFSSSRTQSAE